MTDRPPNSFFHFIVEGLPRPAEDEAWESFYKEAEDMFSWIKGKKIWRSYPTVHQDQDFGINGSWFTIKARVIACHRLPEGMEEAKIKGPYAWPGCRDFFSLTGYGLVKIPEELKD